MAEQALAEAPGRSKERDASTQPSLNLVGGPSANKCANCTGACPDCMLSKLDGEPAQKQAFILQIRAKAKDQQINGTDSISSLLGGIGASIGGKDILDAQPKLKLFSSTSDAPTASQTRPVSTTPAPNPQANIQANVGTATNPTRSAAPDIIQTKAAITDATQSLKTSVAEVAKPTVSNSNSDPLISRNASPTTTQQGQTPTAPVQADNRVITAERTQTPRPAEVQFVPTPTNRETVRTNADPVIPQRPVEVRLERPAVIEVPRIAPVVTAHVQEPTRIQHTTSLEAALRAEVRAAPVNLQSIERERASLLAPVRENITLERHQERPGAQADQPRRPEIAQVVERRVELRDNIPARVEPTATATLERPRAPEPTVDRFKAEPTVTNRVEAKIDRVEPRIDTTPRERVVTEKTLERVIEKAPEKTIERTVEKAPEKALERSEIAVERTLEKTTERAVEKPAEDISRVRDNNPRPEPKPEVRESTERVEVQSKDLESEKPLVKELKAEVPQETFEREVKQQAPEALQASEVKTETVQTVATQATEHTAPPEELIKPVQNVVEQINLDAQEGSAILAPLANASEDLQRTLQEINTLLVQPETSNTQTQIERRLNTETKISPDSEQLRKILDELRSVKESTRHEQQLTRSLRKELRSIGRGSRQLGRKNTAVRMEKLREKALDLVSALVRDVFIEMQRITDVKLKSQLLKELLERTADERDIKGLLRQAHSLRRLKMQLRSKRTLQQNEERIKRLMRRLKSKQNQAQASEVMAEQATELAANSQKASKKSKKGKSLKKAGASKTLSIYQAKVEDDGGEKPESAQ